MLRIPTSADQAPPLLAPQQKLSPGQELSVDNHENKNKRRRSKKKGPADHSWENAPKENRLRRGELRKMRLLLVGTGLLFLVIVAGVIYSLRTGGSPTVVRPIEIAESSAGEKDLKPELDAAPAPRSDLSILAEGESLVSRFLDATSVDELLTIVRNPEVTESRMREFYPDGKVEAVGLSKFNPGGGFSTKGIVHRVPLQTRSLDDRIIVLVDTPLGMKIDWESWVGWSDISWEKFLETKPKTGHVFRVFMSPVDYYNFGFSDDLKWQSYRLESPDKEHSLYGYVEKESMLSHRLLPNPDLKNAAYTLLLKYPENPASDSQVLIERLIGEGWVEDEGATP